MFADPYDSADTRTPDSIMSTGSISLTTWKTPNKLQVIYNLNIYSPSPIFFM